MTGDTAARSGASALTVYAALVFGAAVVLGCAALPVVGVQVLVAAGVAAAGLGVVLLPGGSAVLRAAGGGLVVLGTYLLGHALLLATGTATLPGVVVILLGNGLPALALLALAATGARGWAVGAGVFLALTAVAVLLGAGVDRVTLAVVALTLAALLTAGVAVAPTATRRGDVAGVIAAAAAATAVTHAFGAGGSPVASYVALAWFDYRAGPPEEPGVAVRAIALLVAVVLLVLAVARRDPANGLLAALVLVVPSGDAVLALPLALVVVVALVALRVPSVRAALARLPVATREHPPSGAFTAAAAAVAVVTALVAITLVALPDGRLTGVLALVALLVAGALAHFLAAPAGGALAVVTLVGLALARPWDHVLADGTVAGPLALVTAAAAVWALARRHPTPAVFAAAAYLLLATLPRVTVLDFTLDTALDAAPLVVLLLPLVLLGLPAAVLAFRERTAPAARAVGAVVLGAAILVPAKVQDATVPREPRGESFDPLAPTDAWGAASHVRDLGQATAVVLVLLALVFALVASTARTTSVPSAAAAALTLYGTLSLAHLLMVGSGAAVGVVAWALVAAAAALAAAAWFTSRRPVSPDRLAGP